MPLVPLFDLTFMRIGSAGHGARTSGRRH